MKFPIELTEMGYDNFLVLDIATIRKFTEGRIELVKRIEREEKKSVEALVQNLDRSEDEINKDLMFLFKNGILDLEEEDGKIIPSLRHKTIFMNPIEFEK